MGPERPRPGPGGFDTSRFNATARRNCRLPDGPSVTTPPGTDTGTATAGKTAFDDAIAQFIGVVGCPTSVGRVGLEPTTGGL